MTDQDVRPLLQPIIHGEYAPGFFGLLASRVMDAIMESGVKAARDFGIRAPVRTFSTMVLLKREAMTVTEIAQHLGVTHAAVIKHSRVLEEMGLIERSRDPRDARRRPFALSDQGRAEAARIDDFMAKAARLYQALFDDIGIDVFEGLRRMESGLADRDFATRMRDA